MILWPERGLALNRTSTDIVRMLDGAHSVDDIVAELGVRAGARGADDLGRIAADVNAFLADLEGRALLEWIA